METRITATKLAKSFSDALNRVRYRGERFIIERNGEPIAELGPHGPAEGITLSQLVALLDEVPPAGEDFADDLEAIQAAQPRANVPAWD